MAAPREAPGPAAAPAGPKTLAPELREFLIQFSIALDRYAMYPEGHQSLRPTAGHVLGLLGSLLATRDALSVGVAGNQLVVEGVPTDSGNTVLGEMASRLSGHGIGTLSLRRGLTLDELDGFLRAAAGEPRTEGAPREDGPAWPHVVTAHGRLEDVLTAGPIPEAVLDEVLTLLGAAAADTLLDALVESESRQTRRVLIERLIALGPDIGPAVCRRLDDDRWYVTRNMLALLGALPRLPPGFDASRYAEHADARVRREALRILLREPATRDRAICLGLGDADDHAVRLALTAAARGCPDAAVPLLVARAASGNNPDQRVTAIRVLGTSGHPAALDTLLGIAAPRRGFFGRRPPHKSREYLSALAALSRFRQDPRARDVLELAARSRDQEIAQAAAGRPDETD